MPLPSSRKTNSAKLPNLNEKLDLPNIDKTHIMNSDNELDSVDFSPLSYEEQVKFELEETSEKEQQIPSQVKIPNKKINTPIKENILDPPPDKDKFINKKKKKIIPIGGKRSRVKAKEFDSRKNSLVWIKIIRIFILLIILCIFGFSIKNTFFPSEIYTKAEIEQIAKLSVGETGFPIERGKSFAEEFIKYYVSTDVKDIYNQQVLNRFYSGHFDGVVSNNINKINKTKTKQIALSDPVVFDTKSITNYSTIYKVSVLISDENGNKLDKDNYLSGSWVSYFVNVYYDKKTDELSILPSSPTLIPNYKISNGSDIPFEKPLGNGQSDNNMVKVLTPTIDGFITAYSKASLESHDEIVQYIPSDKPIELISGFGNSVKLEDTPNNSIRKKVFMTNQSNVWKADVYVDWISNETEEITNVNTSRYVMTIEKTADNVYLVTKFNPYTFIKQEE